ncbi:MAG: sigma-70 family RNA polymerase sigma factor [Alphaproteobacteria bacterium]|nr:sigma-70 family RNA polymerase sigma factor [Alphaproteobacteria bacterium]MBV9540333.1 sigma-70 family RNA polymerase sigma factor [Alphaproteobacteria bacterium]MBV9903900.1 sigma-70 family RNA polymerase sigma factor [Alphaproteobacteria bacterium]
MGGSLADAAEANVVMLAALGDDRAFAELVRRRQSSVRGLLRKLSHDATLADDLAQETFVQAWRTLSQLRNAAAFGGWLRQVAVRVFLQHVRKSKLPLETLDDVEDAPASEFTGRLDLQRALEKLSPAQRLCVVLSYGEGMSHGEIVDSTGFPLGTVKSHIARGGARLKQWLGP